MKKKILAITLLLLMVCCSAVAFAACDDDQTVEETHFVLDRANSSVWGITFDGKDSAAIVEQIGAMIPPESAGLAGAFLTQQFVQNLFDQLIDWEKSGVTLRADGTMTLQLILGSEGLDMVNGILSTFNLLNALGGVDVSSFTNQYLVPIMPGFDFADIADSLELAKGALGVQFVSATEGEALEFLQVVGDLLTQYDFHTNLFRTFAGFFGSYAFGEADWYYLVMGALYLILLGRVIQRLWKQKKSIYRWETGAVALTCFVQYAMIVGNSWFIDFQPQGRYLLPILFFIAYLISRIDRVWEDKILRAILVCTCILSLYCFWHVGIPNLVPDMVVLP